MPRYEYTAQTSSGESVTSAAEAQSLPELAARLASRGESITTARERRRSLIFAGSVPHFELVSAYRQIAGAIEAGLPLADTLGMLASESQSPRIRSLMYALATSVAQGVPLSEAMQAIPGVFPKVHTAAVRSGEESGR